MRKEKCILLEFPRTVPVSRMSVLHSTAWSSALTLRLKYQQLIVRSFKKMPFVFSHVEYCDMHFMNEFCDGNARAAVDEYQSRFTN